MPRKIGRLSFAPALGIGVLVLMMLALPAAAAPALHIPSSGAAAVVLAPAAPEGTVEVTVNYAHDWVCMQVLSGAAFQLTVSRGGSTLATLAANAAGDGAYCSYQHNDWQPGQPDIQVGDTVTASSLGVTAAVDPVGEIAGTLNVATSTVSGALHVPAFGQTLLNVLCQVWKENSQVQPILVPNVSANGGAYTCNFGAQGFNVGPGDMIAVVYYEPDGDQVINVFSAPAPDVGIDLWPEGMAVARAGGPAIFRVRYQNHGPAPAANVVVTDTLPANVTFVQATAPVAAEVTPGQVVWRLGSLAPGQAGQFFVVLTNTLPAGSTLQNSMTIGTSSPGDNPGDNQRQATVDVTDGAPDAYISQWLQPGDPRPGDSYLLRIEYGNNGTAPGGPATLHVQLPEGVALQGWTSQDSYEQLWTLTSNTGGHLIFQAPALPARSGGQLLMRAGIGAGVAANTQLISAVWIEAPDDADTTNNGPFTQDVWTRAEARPDLSVDKQWGYGTLAPGAHAFYNINYSNDGNQTQASVRLTDTLPAGTTFVTSTVDANWGSSTPLTPVYQASGEVAWNLGTLPPATWGHFKVELALDGVQPLTTITNTASIQGLDHDRSWGNNHAQAAEQVNPAGANLRIRQTSYWEGPGQIRYELHVENVGTTRVTNVRITDTVPSGLNFNGDWWANWWGGINLVGYDPATHEIVWDAGMMDPGSTGILNFHAGVPPADVGRQGLVHQNTARVTVPNGDVRPDDNSVSDAAWTGPDLFVHTSLWSGKPAPGEVVTFMVDFGNRSNGPWRTGNPAPGSPAVVITDTLPAGLTFVSATDPFAPGQTWTPLRQDGNRLTWGLGGVCTNCRFQFLVTARIGANLGGKELANTAEIADLAPGDVEPFLNNNTSVWTGRVRGLVYLPVLRK